MTANTRRSPETPATFGVDAAALEDYAAFTTLDGDELVLYRRTEDRAWLQSDTFVSLDENR